MAIVGRIVTDASTVKQILSSSKQTRWAEKDHRQQRHVCMQGQPIVVVELHNIILEVKRLPCYAAALR